MRQLKAIFLREFREQVKTKSFKWFLILPVIIALIVKIATTRGEAFSSIFRKIFSSWFKQKIIGVVDKTGKINQSEFELKGYRFIVGDSAYCVKMVKNGKFKGFLIMNENKVTFFTPRPSDYNDVDKIKEIVNYLQRVSRMKEIGLSDDKIRWILEKPDFIVRSIKGQVKETGVLFTASYFITFILFFAITFSAQILAHTVIEEKINRVTELILPHCKINHLLMGKLFGVMLAVFIILFVWLISVYFLFRSLINFMFSGSYLWLSLVCFILGYIFYGTLIMAFAAPLDNEREAHQSALIPMWLMIGAFYLNMFYIVKSPDTNLSFIFSLIPFFTPIVLPVRIFLVQVSPIHIVLPLLSLAIFAILTLLFASKVYRVAIFMYGKKPRIKEICSILFRKF